MSAISTSPVKVPVVPDIVPPLKLPEKVVDVVTPVKNASPSLLNVIPLPTITPFLAVMSPTASIFVTSSYVRVPAMETVPPIETSLTKLTVPPTERTESDQFNVALVVSTAN